MNSIYPKKDEFKRLAENYDLIPVYLELLADIETPVSVLSRFVDQENAFLLESIEGDEKWGRYSFVGVDPELMLEVDHAAGCCGKLQGLKDIFCDVKAAEIPGLPRFFGGAVGYIGYEAMAEFERMPKPKPSKQPIEQKSRFLRVDKLIVFDNFRHTIKLHISILTAVLFIPIQTTLPTTSKYRSRSVSKVILLIILTSNYLPNSLLDFAPRLCNEKTLLHIPNHRHKLVHRH